MNNINELVSHGINIKTAQRMVENYRSKIGTKNGDFEIVDINYDYENHNKDITLKCFKCGNVIHRIMVNGKNKWNELIKICLNCNEKKKNIEFEKFQKEKKDHILSEIGKEYGDYIVSSVEFGNPNKIIMRCMECGSEIKVSYSAIKLGKWKNNKCHKHYRAKIKYDESYIGKQYGFLEVIGISNNYGEKRKFICKCECGKIKLIRPIELENGSHKSCGCKHNALLSTHGGSSDRLYSVWQDMKSRCFYKNDRNYHNYGGRGITICDDWLNYSKFRTWAYSTGYDKNAAFGECTIDRINVNENYEPSNCRWITNKEQQKNKRPSNEWKKRTVRRRSFVNYKNKQINKIDLCKKYGISVPMFDYRIKVKGMNVEEALRTPKLTNGRPKKIECN